MRWSIFYGFLWVFGVKPNRGPKGGLGFLRFLGSLYKSWRLIRVGAKVVVYKVKEVVCVGVWVVAFVDFWGQGK